MAPKQLLTDLPSILSGSGAMVTEEPVPDELFKQGFITKFDCTLDDGGAVWVECLRMPEDAEVFVIVLRPVGGSQAKAMSLMTRLESALKQHGATDDPRQEKKP